MPFGKYWRSNGLVPQSVGVLVRAALPRARGIAEIHGHVRRDAERFVGRHFRALIPRQRPAQMFRQGADCGHEAVADGFGGDPARPVAVKAVLQRFRLAPNPPPLD